MLNSAYGCFSPNHPIDGPAFIPPSPLPLPPRKAKPALPTSLTSLKRPAPDDEVFLASSDKRVKTNGNGTGGDITSPSKKRRLEEDGLVMMENRDDRLEDEVIEID